MWGQVGQQVIDEIGVGIEQAAAFAQGDQLVGEVLQELAFPLLGLAHDVEVRVKALQWEMAFHQAQGAIGTEGQLAAWVAHGQDDGTG